MVQNTRTSPGAGGIRPLGLPQPVEVRTDRQGHPIAIRLNRHWVPVSVGDRWRIDDEWWREDPTIRLYFTFQSVNGALTMVYNDVTTQRWFYQRA